MVRNHHTIVKVQRKGLPQAPVQAVYLETGRERYGTFPVFGETKNEYGAPAPAGKANARFLEKQKQNKWNVAILRGSNKQANERKRNPAIPYFEGFTTAAICWNQSERSLFHGTKNEWSIIATLQKPEGGS